MGMGPGGSGNTGGQANDGGANAGGALGGNEGAGAGTPGSGTSGLGDGQGFSGYGAGASDIGTIARSDMSLADKVDAIATALGNTLTGNTVANDFGGPPPGLGKAMAALLGFTGLPGLLAAGLTQAAVSGKFGDLSSEGLAANFGDPASDPNGNQGGDGGLRLSGVATPQSPASGLTPAVPTVATPQPGGFLDNPYANASSPVIGVGNQFSGYAPAAQANYFGGNIGAYNPNQPNFQFAPGDPGAVAQQQYFRGLT